MVKAAQQMIEIKEKRGSDSTIFATRFTAIIRNIAIKAREHTSLPYKKALLGLRWKSWTKRRPGTIRMYNAEQRAKAIEAFAGFGRSESGVRTNSWTKSVRLQESIAARTGRSFHRCFL